MRKLQIGVIGSAGSEEYPRRKPSKKGLRVAYEVGKLIALKNAVLVCGGKGGVMKEACRGAKKNDGITVGIISGSERSQANKYVDVEVVSGMINCGEESLIVSMCDGFIAIGGGSGTLQEIAIAYRNKKPTVAIKGIPGWADKLANTYLDERQIMKIYVAKTPQEAVRILFGKIKTG
ncbi:MAG: TIGR00725 family protein [Candidatus Levybacteria bacterium]|nr:TIGR00725 family protein [Candidatus Levybacteria bacterium]